MYNTRFLLNQLCLLIVSLLFFSCTICSGQTQGWKYDGRNGETILKDLTNKTPKQARKNLKDFRFSKGGTLLLGRYSDIKANETDTTLLINNYEHRVTVNSVYICDHEVTNAEYREFTKWVSDSIILHTNNKQVEPKNIIYKYYNKSSEVAIAIYPDTATWVKELPYSVNDPMVQLYYSHPAYNDYPVVGITWQQANAYCNWKTERLKEIIAKDKTKKELPNISFRLPTEAEWEMAADGHYAPKFENINDYQTYPWIGYSLRSYETNHYLANFGVIFDQNNYGVKWYIDDGGFYPTKIKSYPPNDIKIYDMAGNVAEWTSDIPQRLKMIGEDDNYRVKNTRSMFNEAEKKLADSVDKAKSKAIEQYRIIATDDLPTAIKKMTELDQYYMGPKGDDRPYYLPRDIPNKMKWIEQFAANELHDAKVLATDPNMRMVKGGSWASGPTYMLCASREVFPENKCCSRIGFRLVLDVGK